MEDDPPPVRCPCCGSAYTSPLKGSEMWQCHHDLCRAVFPVYQYRGGCQMAIVAEEDPAYLRSGTTGRDISPKTTGERPRHTHAMHTGSFSGGSK